MTPLPPPGHLRQMLAGLPTAFGRAVGTFPAPFLFALAAAGAAILGNHDTALHLSPAVEGALGRIMLLWPLVLSAGVGSALGFHGHLPLRRAAQLAVTIAAIALWFLLPNPSRVPTAFWFGYWAAVGAVALAGGVLLTRTRPPRTFWDGAWPLLTALLLAGIASVIAIVGVNLALLSVDKLFGVRFSNVYGDVFFAGFFLLWPAATLVRLSNGLPPPPIGLPAWLLGFARWVFVPLCAVYAAILYAYSAKMLFAGSWPDGWVAMPVLLLGAIGLLAYQIARPARDRTAAVWAAGFCRVLPWVLGPLAVLLLLALQVRIGEYGLTEPRVLGIFLGTWLVIVSIAIALRPGLEPAWLPLSLAAWLTVASTGPFSMAALSLPSQQQRLDTLVSDLDLLGSSNPSPVSEKDRDQLRENIRYLIGTHGVDKLPTEIRNRWEAYAKLQRPRAERNNVFHVTREVLAALNVSDRDRDRYTITFRLDAAPTPLPGFGAFSFVALFPDSEPNAGAFGPFRIEIRGGELLVTADGRPVGEGPLAELQRRLLARAPVEGNNPVTLPARDLTVDLPWAGRSYRLVFTSLKLGETTRDNQRSDYVGEFTALLFIP